MFISALNYIEVEVEAEFGNTTIENLTRYSVKQRFVEMETEGNN